MDAILLQTDHAPSMPEINSPPVSGEVIATLPELIIDNSMDPDGDELVYEFQLYSDAGFTQLVDESLNVTETTTTTSWQSSEGLLENTWYYWRVRASDGVGFSLWRYGSFFVNTINEAPGPISVSGPAESYNVDSVQPNLSVTNSSDPDEDTVAYVFTVYSHPEMTLAVASSGSIEAGESITSWQVTPALNDNSTYYWKTVATDPDGETSEIASLFYVQTGNQAPSAPMILWPGYDTEISALTVFFGS